MEPDRLHALDRRVMIRSKFPTSMIVGSVLLQSPRRFIRFTFRR